MSAKGARLIREAKMTDLDMAYFLGYVAESIPERMVRAALASLEQQRERQGALDALRDARERRA